MPGADHCRPVQFSFRQRPAAMTADVIDRVKVAINIVDTDRFAIDLKAFGATGLDLLGFANPDEIRHFFVPLLGWCKFSVQYTDSSLGFKCRAIAVRLGLLLS